MKTGRFFLAGVLAVLLPADLQSLDLSPYDKYALESCVATCRAAYDPMRRVAELSDCVQRCERTYGERKNWEKDLPRGIR